MLRIHIGSITEVGWNLDEQVDAHLLPLFGTLSREASVCFTRPVHACVHAKPAGESILIDGRVQTAVRLTCSRCLEPFELMIESDFSTTALPANSRESDDGNTEDIELTADEMDVLTYQGDCIDLRHEIAQQILMTLPFNPLCRESCKGLCSRCGADLNRTACQCHHQDESSPFAALSGLTFPKEKE